MESPVETAKDGIKKVYVAIEDNKETKTPKSSPSSTLFSNVNIMDDILNQKLPDFDENSDESDENDSFKEDGLIMRRKKVKKRYNTFNMRSLESVLPKSSYVQTTIKDES
ncbi:uncharacterized protein LOC111634569 isoform X2 [Centruroides sculpturatus]|uniref:uncharacterized protein LOC111634569 isoform X2 n=1 Tax=Centruroides sculpturatus TaxID=218467 RepID=UPI000C6E5092|nr:uncharacterized protein LOC111634569 isoform X2 [Centruroides sculpturatus]